MASKTKSSNGTRPGARGSLGNLLHGILRDLLDPYRPELHYMRGPGPRWHAKHDGNGANFAAMTGLVRVRVKR